MNITLARAKGSQSTGQMKLTTGVVAIREIATREWATRELAINSDVFSETGSCSAQPG